MAAQPARRSARRVERTEVDRPRLRLIDHRVLRRLAVRRLIFTMMCALFALGIFAVALAQAELVEGQRRMDETRRSLTEVQAEKARLEREVDRASSPAEIVDRARAMGMVRAADPVYFMAVRPVVERPQAGD